MLSNLFLPSIGKVSSHVSALLFHILQTITMLDEERSLVVKFRVRRLPTDDICLNAT